MRKSDESTQKEAVSEAKGTAKEDLPLSKYPETVTVHLGGSLNPNAKLPAGMAYDDNTYLDLLKKILTSKLYMTGLRHPQTLKRNESVYRKQ